MLRIGRLTDYGTMILGHLASRHAEIVSASDVAQGTRLALPTVQKLLKILARASLVASVRGADGGYRLARDPEDISAAEVLDALEGPVALTECASSAGQCDLESLCQVGSAWQRINVAIRGALEDITLADLREPPKSFSKPTLVQRRTIESERGNAGPTT